MVPREAVLEESLTALGLQSQSLKRLSSPGGLRKQLPQREWNVPHPEGPNLEKIQVHANLPRGHSWHRIPLHERRASPSLLLMDLFVPSLLMLCLKPFMTLVNPFSRCALSHLAPLRPHIMHLHNSGSCSWGDNRPNHRLDLFILPLRSFSLAFSFLGSACPSLSFKLLARALVVRTHHVLAPCGVKKFKIALRDWNFQARLKRMTFSSEIENFKRATHQTPSFVGNSEGRDWKIQARLKFSSEIENFKRKLEIFKRSSEIDYFSRFGPSGHFSRKCMGGLGTPFWDFLGISGPHGLGTPVYGGCNRNTWGSKRAISEDLGPCKIVPVNPHPLNLRGAISPPKILGVECPKPLVLQCFLGGRTLNLGGEIVTPKNLFGLFLTFYLARQK